MGAVISEAPRMSFPGRIALDLKTEMIWGCLMLLSSVGKRGSFSNEMTYQRTLASLSPPRPAPPPPHNILPGWSISGGSNGVFVLRQLQIKTQGDLLSPGQGSRDGAEDSPGAWAEATTPAALLRAQGLPVPTLSPEFDF